MMKNITKSNITYSGVLILMFLSFQFSIAQTPSDPVSDSVVTEPAKKSHDRTSDVKIYAGLTVSQIIESSSTYESGYSTGFNLGVSYRQGRFAYWEIGARYNGSVVLLSKPNETIEETLGIRQVEIPISGGLNLLSPVRRVLGLRLFMGISPGLVISIADNSLDLAKDDFNSFQFSGHAGVGVDIAFLFVEAGIDYGFTDVLVNENSNMTQIFINLGFRF
jgi:hypothetical protein